ncbi:MAG: mechanosensitive ion channel [Sphingobacterium sp.]
MNFTPMIENFTDRIGMALPNVLGALLILLVGWLIARGIRALIVRLMQRTSWDEKLFKGVTGGKDTNKFVGNIFYYLLMIIVFLIVLETLGVSSVLTPLEEMVTIFLAFIPHIIAAIIIGFIGYLLAKFISNLVSFGGKMIIKWANKAGLKEGDQVVKVIRTLVFLIIFIPILIQAINTLQLEAISGPLNELLGSFVGMIGDIILATVILIVFVWGGKYLIDFLIDLFRNLGLDRIAEKIHIQNIIGAGQFFSKVLGNILYFFLVFFGLITSVDVLGLDQLSFILLEILHVTGAIAFGVLILLLGNFISRLIYNAMIRSEKNNFIASVVRYATLGLFLGISLRSMGIANEIVELAFGLTLGSLAIVIALSYGLGGRDAAGEHFKEIIQKFKGDTKSKSDPSTPSDRDTENPKNDPTRFH